MDLGLYAMFLVAVLVSCTSDVLFGFAGACKTKTVSSGKMRDGLWHKAGLLGLFALAFGLEYATGLVDLGFTAPLVPIVTLYIVAMEAVSIFESLCQLCPQLRGSKMERLLHSSVIDEQTKKGETDDL